jgi:hypothetical protein
MQWLQDPNQSNVDNLNNLRCEASRHFRNKRKNVLKLELINLKLTVKYIYQLFIRNQLLYEGLPT